MEWDLDEALDEGADICAAVRVSETLVVAAFRRRLTECLRKVRRTAALERSRAADRRAKAHEA